MHNLTEFAVVGVYLVFMIVVGLVMKRFNNNADDYFRSGARSAWWLMGPSMMMSMTSASVFTASAGALFESGIAPLAVNFAQFFSGFILAAVLAAWFRQTRAITGPEIIRERFGPVTQQVFSYLNMIMQPIYGAFQLLGLSIFVSAVFGYPLWAVVIVLGVVVGVYSVSGGRWAVMATDFLQTLTLLPVIILVSVLALLKMGGIGQFLQRAGDVGAFKFVHETGAFSDNRYSWKWIVAIFIMQLVSQLQLGWASRFLSAKDGTEARKAALCMTAIGMIMLPFLTIPALVAKVLYVEEVAAYGGILSKAAESAYVVVCKDLLPAGMMGLVIVAMFAATASSMDTGINTNAGVAVRNVVPPLRRLRGQPPLDPRKELMLGQRFSVALAGLIIALALYLATNSIGGLFEMILGFSARVQFPIALPLLLALFMKRAPRVCVLFSMGTGLVLPWLLQPVIEQYLAHPLDFADRVLLIGACTFGGYAFSYAFSKFESPEDRALTAAFNLKMRTPVDFESEIGGGNDADQLRTIGRLTQILSVGFFCLLLVPNEASGRWMILILSLGVGLVGTGMVWMARRLLRREARSPDAAQTP